MSEPQRSVPDSRPTQRAARRRGAVLIGVVVLLLHGLALDAAEIGVPAPAAPAAPGALPVSVRLIEPTPSTAPVDTPAGPLPPKPTRRPVHRVAAARAVPVDAVPVEIALAAPPEATERVADPAAAGSTPPPAVDAPVAPPAPAASGPIAPDAPIPVYKTRIAPAMTLHYELRRGGITGNGELQWRPQDQAYELRLEGKVAGITLLTQVSQGEIDAHGLAPLRFTDQRTRRPAQAANFQRDKGVISFSGPTDQYALVPGVQDRLSWMLQLGAIVAAEPARARPGQKVALYVVGSRGEVDTWVMDFVGTESVETGGVSVKALKFLREPRKPMDSRIEIWLDPARHYLPVHAKQANGGDGGDVFELLLKDASSMQ